MDDTDWTVIRRGTIDAEDRNGALIVTNDCNLRVMPGEMEGLIRDRRFDCFEVEVRVRPIVRDLKFAAEMFNAMADSLETH